MDQHSVVVDHAAAATGAVAGDVPCEQCGYNLRGLTADRCPECGRPFDRAATSAANIPWVHRDQLGTFRAYWKTVFWVTSDAARFAREILRPVQMHARDAQA